MAKMLVGPVIGKLTDTTVRVLIEVDKDQEVTCNATDSKGKKFSRGNHFGSISRPFLPSKD